MSNLLKKIKLDTLGIIYTKYLLHVFQNNCNIWDGHTPVQRSIYITSMQFSLEKRFDRNSIGKNTFSN